MTLIELFAKYNTDKHQPNGGHNYGHAYADLLAPMRSYVFDVLELGVLGGSSLRAWRDYFPKAHVLGLDLNPNLVGWTEDRIETAKCNVADEVELNTVLGVRTFDIIIDDASHWESDQLKSHEVLWRRVRPGGLYVIEDVQCVPSHEEFAKRGAEIIDLRDVSGRFDDVLAVFRKPFKPAA